MDKTYAFFHALGMEIADLGVDGGIFPGKRLYLKVIDTGKRGHGLGKFPLVARSN
jgi:hypothetical protein